MTRCFNTDLGMEITTYRPDIFHTRTHARARTHTRTHTHDSDTAICQFLCHITNSSCTFGCRSLPQVQSYLIQAYLGYKPTLCTRLPYVQDCFRYRPTSGTNPPKVQAYLRYKPTLCTSRKLPFASLSQGTLILYIHHSSGGPTHAQLQLGSRRCWVRLR